MVVRAPGLAPPRHTPSKSAGAYRKRLSSVRDRQTLAYPTVSLATSVRPPKGTCDRPLGYPWAGSRTTYRKMRWSTYRRIRQGRHVEIVRTRLRQFLFG